ncbi:MAG TPA: hypothetical protein VF980_08925 [Thermoanaerobaculia bacterium]
MKRRASKSAAAMAVALLLSLSTPSLYAAQRDGGIGQPDFGTRIVRIVKHFLSKFTLAPYECIIQPSPPKP